MRCNTVPRVALRVVCFLSISVLGYTSFEAFKTHNVGARVRALASWKGRYSHHKIGDLGTIAGEMDSDGYWPIKWDHGSRTFTSRSNIEVLNNNKVGSRIVLQRDLVPMGANLNGRKIQYRLKAGDAGTIKILDNDGAVFVKFDNYQYGQWIASQDTLNFNGHSLYKVGDQVKDSHGNTGVVKSVDDGGALSIQIRKGPQKVQTVTNYPANQVKLLGADQVCGKYPGRVTIPAPKCTQKYQCVSNECVPVPNGESTASSSQTSEFQEFTPAFQVGQHVSALWNQNSAWRLAVVKAIHVGRKGYDILFNDYQHKTLFRLETRVRAVSAP